MSTFRSVFLLSLGAAAVVGGVGACADKPGAQPTGQTGQAKGAASGAPATSASTTLSSSESRDAGAARSATADAGAAAYDGPLIGALFHQTPVMSDMEWPKDEEKRKPGDKAGSVRIGYLRQGSKVPVIAQPHPKSNCKEGWYELVQGGFVCGKYASLDLSHPRIKIAPHAPDTAGNLPYQYGYNVGNGTPLYRTIPSREERVRLEPWLTPKKAKRRAVDDDSSASNDELDAGAALLTRTTATTSDPFAVGVEDSGTPWYLRDYDGGKPQVTLEDLRGEGPVAKRMVKGFFLALDKDLSNNGSRWWKNTSGLLAPYERIFVHKTASDFHGTWLDQPAQGDDEPAQIASASDGGALGAAAPRVERKAIEELCKPGSKAQVGIFTGYKSKKYIVSTSRKAVTTGDPVSRHTVLRLTGDSVSINGATYDETEEGWWMRAADGTKTRPGDPPKDLKPGEKWIDVNVKTQTLVAYEGDKAVFATAVSTGKEDKADKDKDHHTPPGTFRIREKHIAATMDGDVASDGPYSIEDVPWIMYFNGSYALHGAFWHNNFGRMQSHGCVNLAPADAKALFGWTEPRVPEGWHAVWSTPEKPGTRVVVHE
jgi:lipoprotein-anchoring transpeptidase ErfK/SrfK